MVNGNKLRTRFSYPMYIQLSGHSNKKTCLTLFFSTKTKWRRLSSVPTVLLSLYSGTLNYHMTEPFYIFGGASEDNITFKKGVPLINLYFTSLLLKEFPCIY